MILSISEILDKVSKEKSLEGKVALLHQHDSHTLRVILKMAFFPGIKWRLPDTVPPYKKSEYIDVQGALYREIRKIPMFVEGSELNVKQFRLEQLYIQMLETIDKDDAALVSSIVNLGKMPYKTVTAKLVDRAFPGLLPQVQEQEDGTEQSESTQA